MPSIQAPFVSVALSRLRAGVCVCSWVVGLSLITQLLMWCIASFMDVRYETLQPHSAADKIVSAEESKQSASVTSAQPPNSRMATPVDVNRVRTKHDTIMN